MMRAVRGVVNGILMLTLIKPMVRVMVRRWRRRVQESPATAIGLQVQELFEAALVEELAPPVTELEVLPDEIVDIVEDSGGLSLSKVLLVAVGIAVSVAATYAIVDYIRERRAAQAREAELVVIPVEPESDETIEDVVQEALVE